MFSIARSASFAHSSPSTSGIIECSLLHLEISSRPLSLKSVRTAICSIIFSVDSRWLVSPAFSNSADNRLFSVSASARASWSFRTVLTMNHQIKHAHVRMVRIAPVIVCQLITDVFTIAATDAPVFSRRKMSGMRATKNPATGRTNEKRMMESVDVLRAASKLCHALEQRSRNACHMKGLYQLALRR